MNNADKPAYPLNQKTIEEIGDGYWFDIGLGLTKLERFAMAAMQGLLTHDPETTRMLGNPNGRKLNAWVAQQSVSFADALLAELEKEKADPAKSQP